MVKCSYHWSVCLIEIHEHTTSMSSNKSNNLIVYRNNKNHFPKGRFLYRNFLYPKHLPIRNRKTAICIIPFRYMHECQNSSLKTLCSMCVCMEKKKLKIFSIFFYSTFETDGCLNRYQPQLKRHAQQRSWTIRITFVRCTHLLQVTFYIENV